MTGVGTLAIPPLQNNSFSTHPSKGNVVGASSWQVVCMLHDSTVISAHLLYCSGFAVFVLVLSARLQWFDQPLPALPATWHVCSARADGLLPADRGCIDSLQLRTVGKQLGATLWSSAGMRPLLYSQPPVTTALSLTCLHQSEQLRTLKTYMTLILLYRYASLNPYPANVENMVSS